MQNTLKMSALKLAAPLAYLFISPKVFIKSLNLLDFKNALKNAGKLAFLSRRGS